MGYRDYICKKCNNKFDNFSKTLAPNKVVICPKCKSKQTKEIPSIEKSTKWKRR